jgi:hypothetical protein
VTVSLRVVVVGVDHNLARDALARQLAVATEGHRDEEDLAEPRGLGSGRCPAPIISILISILLLRTSASRDNCGA